MIRLDSDQLEQLDKWYKNPLSSPIGRRLSEIAAAATGEMADIPENRDEIYGAIQNLLEQLFAPTGEAYTIPGEFWSSDLGQMVQPAWFWCRGDQLITQAQAAETCGMSIQSINNYIRAGRLNVYSQTGDAHRPGGRLLSKHEVETLCKRPPL